MCPIGFLYRGLALNPGGIAAKDDARALTYRALVAEVEAAASALQDRGVGAGDRVGICAENNLQHMVAMPSVRAQSVERRREYAAETARGAVRHVGYSAGKPRQARHGVR